MPAVDTVTAFTKIGSSSREPSPETVIVAVVYPEPLLLIITLSTVPLD